MPNLSLKTLHLRDYRCFDSLDIEFHQQLTVLVATNGSGKTSVLDAIAVAFGPYIGAFDESVGRNFEPSDIRLSRVRKTASNEMEHAPQGVRLAAAGHIPLSDILLADLGVESDLKGTHSGSRWQRSLAGPTKARTTIKEADQLVAYGKYLQEHVRTPGTEVTLPLLAYYGTGRLWYQKKFMAKKLTRTSRTVGYADCLDPGSSYKSFDAWFRYWTTNAFKGQLDASQAGRAYEATEFDHYIQSVGNAVNTCLALTGWKDIAYSLSREELVAHHEEHGELPVTLLSDGIRNMIGMVADIAFRATKLNPQLASEAALQRLQRSIRRQKALKA